LSEQLKKERIENAQAARGRSPAKYNQRQRSTSANRGYNTTGPDVSMLEASIGELRRNLAATQNDNDKLKDTMREMVDDYTHQLELRDETIQRLENSQPNTSAFRQEIQDLENELRIVRDQNIKLIRDNESV